MSTTTDLREALRLIDSALNNTTSAFPVTDTMRVEAARHALSALATMTEATLTVTDELGRVFDSLEPGVWYDVRFQTKAADQRWLMNSLTIVEAS